MALSAWSRGWEGAPSIPGWSMDLGRSSLHSAFPAWPRGAEVDTRGLTSAEEPTNYLVMEKMLCKDSMEELCVTETLLFKDRYLQCFCSV